MPSAARQHGDPRQAGHRTGPGLDRRVGLVARPFPRRAAVRARSAASTRSRLVRPGRARPRTTVGRRLRPGARPGGPRRGRRARRGFLARSAGRRVPRVTLRRVAPRRRRGWPAARRCLRRPPAGRPRCRRAAPSARSHDGGCVRPGSSAAAAARVGRRSPRHRRAPAPCHPAGRPRRRRGPVPRRIAPRSVFERGSSARPRSSGSSPAARRLRSRSVVRLRRRSAASRRPPAANRRGLAGAGSPSGPPGVRGLAPRPFLERRADRERAREAVRLLVRQRARCRLGLREAAMAVVGTVGALIPVVFEGDERAGRGTVHAGQPSFRHRAR